jgi:hypothetical protein
MASTKTALQVVNLVLKNLRKTQVSDFSASYTALILEFINKAKRETEDSHTWSHLRDALTFSTVLNQQSYDLSAAGTTPVITGAGSPARFANERSKIAYDAEDRPMVFDITSSTQPVQLREYAPKDLDVAQIMGQQSSQQLQPYGFSFATPAGVPTLKLLNPPPASRSMKVYMHLPQDDLANTTDVMLVPWDPVVLRATTLAFAERGEELGPDGQDWGRMAENALQMAIGRDTPDNESFFYAD